ncbi:GNAT family N-acetyltransferase [Vibrio nitrifigilis]|uniref:GNAT family N-acetyltransferase n=1 Tax=Vibrio nitrifigilis TaxID=2789781 RepID=A0ABS0GFS5_9VIBR|nr:GNAT family N-acetyltransferase [Vibrio nitrifigilis]MBF9001267.1 GNAT family N-acetyltransferase [Vibrio nitrifigilis]
MSTLLFETLDPIKIPLIKRFYKEHYPGTKPKSDELTIVAYDDSVLVGVVRFRHVGQLRLLTGMAISSSKRGQGIGQQLLAYCVEHILQNDDYCFAYSHLKDFYQNGGFEKISPEQLPADLKTLYQRYTQHGKDLIPMHFRYDR